MAWKITFTTLGDLPLNVAIFITHVRNLVMGAMPMNMTLPINFLHSDNCGHC